MRIGILGSGLMGGKLGTLFARAGHEVVFSYARSKEKLKKLARDAYGNTRSGDELINLQQKTANALADYLVSDLSRSVIPARRQNESRRTRADAWIITGEFVRVNEGSRALRGLIGLGAGGTKMETVVRIYDLSQLSKEPVLQFETSGGSNAEPGAVLGGMFGALPNALRNAGVRGVTDDTVRSAREITAMVADYYVKNGGQLPAYANNYNRIHGLPVGACFL
jgi:hypothetical protein